MVRFRQLAFHSLGKRLPTNDWAAATFLTRLHLMKVLGYLFGGNAGAVPLSMEN
jgi:hypothetical protein